MNPEAKPFVFNPTAKPFSLPNPPEATNPPAPPAAVDATGNEEEEDVDEEDPLWKATLALCNGDRKEALKKLEDPDASQCRCHPAALCERPCSLLVLVCVCVCV